MGVDGGWSPPPSGMRGSEEGWRGERAGLSWFESSKYMKRQANCAVVVASMSEIYRAFKAGDPRPLEATRELFHCPGIRKCSKPSLSLSLSLSLWNFIEWLVAVLFYREFCRGWSAFMAFGLLFCLFTNPSVGMGPFAALFKS